MDEILGISKIYDLIVTTAFFYMIADYFNLFFEKKKAWSGQMIILAGVYYIFNVLVNRLLGQTVLLHIANMFAILGMGCCLYMGTLKRKIFSVLVFDVIWIISETVIAYLFVFVSADFDQMYFLGTVISKILMFFIIRFIRIMQKRRSLLELPLKYWALLCVVPLGSAISIRNEVSLLLLMEDQTIVFNSIGNVVILLVLNLVIFWIYDKMAEEAQLETENIIFRQQLALCSQQAEERESVMLDIRKMKHDMKNHLISLKGLACSGKREAFEVYIDGLIQSNERGDDEIACSGNIVIDSLINHKYRAAQKANIGFELILDIPSSLPFGDGDLCMIIGNALDNAIEAVEKLEKQKRIILIKMTYPHRNLQVMIVNNYSGDAESDAAGFIHTTKADKHNHGLGILSIQKAAAQYDGLVELKAEAQKMTLLVLLYNPVQ